jgi:hypothetical protein
MAVALVASAALALTSPVYAALLALQGAFYAAALAGARTGAPALRIPAYLLVANLGVLLAWVRFLRGERIAMWSPSERLAALPPAAGR